MPCNRKSKGKNNKRRNKKAKKRNQVRTKKSNSKDNKNQDNLQLLPLQRFQHEQMMVNMECLEQNVITSLMQHINITNGKKNNHGIDKIVEINWNILQLNISKFNSLGYGLEVVMKRLQSMLIQINRDISENKSISKIETGDGGHINFHLNASNDKYKGSLNPTKLIVNLAEIDGMKYYCYINEEGQQDFLYLFNQSIEMKCDLLKKLCCNLQERELWREALKLKYFLFKKRIKGKGQCICCKKYGIIKLCSRCKKKKYCNRRCQKIDWKRHHKHYCKSND